MSLRSLILATVLLAGLTVSAQTQAPIPPRPAGAPRLLVILVLDQFRADYPDWYGKQWTKGLRRLFDKGAVFSQTAYPYAATYTCAGHSTISTGAFPATHGMSSNDFYDRALRRLVPCAFDPSVASVPFGGGTGREHHSARSLLVPTFGEELRRQSAQPTHIVSIAQKPRSSVTLAGRGSPDTTAVFEEDDGTWATSEAYATTPWPDVDEFVRAHPMKAAYGAIWNPLMPASAYRWVDNGVGEGRPAPWTQTFPHPLISSKGVPDNEFVTAWERSPWDDEFLTDLAIHLLRTKRLGTGPGTDLLTLSLPSLDHNGHEFGPRSHEVQDVLFRNDVNIGRLLDAIDQQVGAGNYAVGLTGDHGVALIPEQAVAEGGDAGRVSAAELRTAANAAIERALGVQGPHVAFVYDSQVGLAPGVYDQLRTKADGFKAVKAAITGVRGIAAAYSADDIVGGGDTTDPVLRAWRLSYVPGRSGDFVFTPKANWIVRATGTTHGTMNVYDQRVPLVLYGALIKQGRYDVASSPADIVTTFASLMGIKLPRAQGRALTEAISR